ncbi:hypothetical protein [Xylanimonas protaetiae]|uniref:DUF998 domain-containing protein n=1 Tax=Xylanimonas protaetiae TaxID=2509457 RepID=A0A4P6F5U2_9MICO|nr:hypothetical protein [Xylanimonas protaetiae]QAY70766.1 hypothetical protein ET471_12655 [Xylanimonas protaetiae]
MDTSTTHGAADVRTGSTAGADAPAPGVRSGLTKALDEASPELISYLGLRVAIIALTALLAVAVFLENAHLRELSWDGKLEGFVALGSISSYWYTSAQSVFIAVLVGYGICLIAIKGETSFEETCLNASGLCAPVVGFVPTYWASCGAVAPYRTWCQGQSGFEGRIATSIVATLVAGGVVIAVFLALTVLRGRGPAPHVIVGFAVTVGFYVAMLVWFVVARDGFVRGAHGVAAIGLFGGVFVVAVSRTLRARTRPDPAVKAPVAALYLVSTVALGLSLVAVVGIFLAVPAAEGSSRLFWIEWVLLFFFVVFWLVQTLDFWERKRPR